MLIIIAKLYNADTLAIWRTLFQLPTPIFWPAILFTAVPSAIAGNIIKLSNLWEALNPATVSPPNWVTTLSIAALPPWMTAICKPAGIPNFKIKMTSSFWGSLGTVKGISWCLSEWYKLYRKARPCDTTVDNAAPTIPNWKTPINNGAKIALSTTAKNTIRMGVLLSPSARDTVFTKL